MYSIPLPTMSPHMQPMLLICGWRQEDPLKCQYTSSRLHTITCQETAIAQKSLQEQEIQHTEKHLKSYVSPTF
jgi:hypothetical protein